MSDIPQQQRDVLLAAHGRICDEYGRLEELRSTQLTSVPSATVLLGGASVFLGAMSSSGAFRSFVLALGFLGMFATFALYFREVELECESNSVVQQLMTYEGLLGIPNTIVSARNTHRFFNRENASILIYASSFTAWFCVATWFILPGIAIFLAIFVLVAVLVVQRVIRDIRLQHSGQQGVVGV